ncbi:hypothetical protein BJ912DRAFT_1050476 [Pholiota molesta]|nr:hypothetical protein BJ912DRAFT_1050476 [Pholiota molesta]
MGRHLLRRSRRKNKPSNSLKGANQRRQFAFQMRTSIFHKDHQQDSHRESNQTRLPAISYQLPRSTSGNPRSTRASGRRNQAGPPTLDTPPKPLRIRDVPSAAQIHERAKKTLVRQIQPVVKFKSEWPRDVGACVEVECSVEISRRSLNFQAVACCDKAQAHTQTAREEATEFAMTGGQVRLW